MIKKSLTFLALGLGVSFATAPLAAQKIPVSAAIAQCKDQARWDQNEVMDGGTDPIQHARGKSHFRSCVFAKSGKYPPTERKSGITISGSARIGIVVKK
ncbi:hypothetical protein [Amylibacter sp. IMCC11727]|uniref:hypothetical protein n=1 Tax=Amylibacter sp. IMCC11727 TaxID=3039851 RepID=UPI00244E2400|nr:hypothetical protein [Amylibacter sp. IMCC11727]WGI23138.1 hypothetical protein QBD29_06880 [Amylibacter sp. IMCC11727]